MVPRQSLPKSERLHSRKLMDELFGAGSRAMTSFPLRLVYRQVEGVNPCQVLVSVPKRNLHRANKRNRVKRQVREAYRRNKTLVEGCNLLMALIWLDDKLHPSDVVERSVVSLLTRVAEKVKR